MQVPLLAKSENCLSGELSKRPLISMNLDTEKL